MAEGVIVKVAAKVPVYSVGWRIPALVEGPLFTGDHIK